jgi:ribulose-phosphate 3-epimerase
MTIRRKRVVPALLTDSVPALKEMLAQAESFTDYIQIDIMDGLFVPSRSVTWQDIAGMSFSLQWDAHLMVNHPLDFIEGFHRAGAQRITFHYEALDGLEHTIASIRSLGLEVGLALKPETPVSAVMPLSDSIDTTLFLSVEPGFYGSPFLPGVLDKVKEFRAAKLGIEIGIDGGIKETNIVEVVRSGADSICVGSAVFMQKDPGQCFRYLTSLIEEM